MTVCAAAALASDDAIGDVRRLYDQQRYTDVLREVSKLLALRGDAARGIDRAALCSLKAESHLRLKQSALAADAFSAAAKESDDPGSAATFRATALLLKRSKNNSYARRDPSKPAESFDIVDANSRRSAIEALFADESLDADARVKAILRAGNLGAVFDASAVLRPLADLERAATGSDESTKGRLLALGDISHDLIQASLKQMSNRVEQIARRANEKHRGGDNAFFKRGLAPGDANELQNVKDTCDKIPAAVERLTRELGTDPEHFKALMDEASKLRDRAHVVQVSDYTGIYGEP